MVVSLTHTNGVPSGVIPPGKVFAVDRKITCSGEGDILLTQVGREVLLHARAAVGELDRVANSNAAASATAGCSTRIASSSAIVRMFRSCCGA